MQVNCSSQAAANHHEQYSSPDVQTRSLGLACQHLLFGFSLPAVAVALDRQDLVLTLGEPALDQKVVQVASEGHQSPFRAFEGFLAHLLVQIDQPGDGGFIYRGLVVVELHEIRLWYAAADLQLRGDFTSTLF